MKDKLLLCLDDEKIVLDSLKEQIKSRFKDEFYIEFAQSSDEAFEIIDEMKDEGIKVLLVISDWLMPGMKGDEFLIGLHKLYPKVVKIMLTGQADEEAVERAVEHANLYKCINKPWRKAELVQIIEDALEEVQI